MMMPETFEKTMLDAARGLEEKQPDHALAMKLEARRQVEQSLEAMRASGEIVELTDEEVRLVHCFRAFRSRGVKPGSVFKWQTHPDVGVVLTEAAVVLVRDPQDRND